MARVSTRWNKAGRCGIARFLLVTIVFSIGFICTVSATGASLSSNRASIPECLASASDASFSRKRLPALPDVTPDVCPDPTNDPLGPGNASADLVVKNGTCVVNAGSYMYHNINIVKGGTLQFSDANITLNAANIIIENQGTMRAGSVDGAGNITPIAGPLTIHLYGANQGPGGAGASCTDPTCGVPNKNGDDVWQSNKSMTMYPDSCKKTQNLGGSGVNDCFYRYDAMPFDNGKTTGGTGACSVGNGNCGYYGYKALGVGYGATLQLYGKKGATYDKTIDPTNTGTSWVRLNNCDPAVNDPAKQCNKGVLQPGANTLVLSKPVDWQMDDNIVIGSTDYLPGHAEKVQISCVNDPVKCPGKMTFKPALR